MKFLKLSGIVVSKSLREIVENGVYGILIVLVTILKLILINRKFAGNIYT